MSQQFGLVFDCCFRHESLCRLFIHEQRFDLPSQVQIRAARTKQEFRPLIRIEGECVGVDVFDCLQPLWTHLVTASVSSRSNHALAKFQCRMTVIGATANASAVSSTLKPAKCRSSII